jgi:serine/threonine protein kinase
MNRGGRRALHCATVHAAMPPPRQVGPFRIVRRLGAGALAEVFLAVAYGASGFERRVALKVLRPELQGDGDAERVLLDEARLAGRIQHRNVVGVHDVGAAGGLVWVRMDWLDGGDLATLTAGAPMPEGLALYVAHELALALAWLHQLPDDDGRPLGLVHRDVSPHNVLVSRAGEVKLGDFGIAKATLHREDTQSGVRKGKYGYMSPEQVQAAPLSAASDRFALGVTLCELLTGARPFDGEGPLDTMERIRDAAPPALPGLAPDLRALVHACLAQSPAARPTADALCDALAQALAARPPVDARHLGAWVTARAAAAL